MTLQNFSKAQYNFIPANGAVAGVDPCGLGSGFTDNYVACAKRRVCGTDAACRNAIAAGRVWGPPGRFRPADAMPGAVQAADPHGWGPPVGNPPERPLARCRDTRQARETH